MTDISSEQNGTEQPGASMMDLLNGEYDYNRPRRGDIRRGTVVRIEADVIVVDIGAKRDGIVPSRDIERLEPEMLAGISVGDEVPVYIMHPETRDGDTIVSLNMARQALDWDKAQKLMDSGDIYEGEVSGYNKGGLIVPFGRLQGFVPASQIANLNGRVEGGSHMDRLAQLVGMNLPLKVIEVSQHRRRLILSERAAQREWRTQQREKLFETIEEGEICEGVVSNLCDFGAFVELGGADGLIHISELSWNRVKHPREVLKVGQSVKAYVLKVDREKQRIGLSLKKLQNDPWSAVEEKYSVGQVVQGKITNLVKFGAFAQIEPGLEGLIHISELADGNVAEPSEVVKVGDELTLQIVSIDSPRQRMGLSLRRVPLDQRTDLDSDQDIPSDDLSQSDEETGDELLTEVEVSDLEADVDAEAGVAEEDGLKPEFSAEPLVADSLDSDTDEAAVSQVEADIVTEAEVDVAEDDGLKPESSIDTPEE